MGVGDLLRSPAMSQKGMVCSNSPLAASAGIKVFLDGGNAFDAAIAVAATEGVTITPSCGMGGDVFALLYEASTQRLVGLNGSGGAPSDATPEFYRSKGYQKMPLTGVLAASVPGEVDAWETIHKAFCTMPFAQLLEPAIGYAQGGVPVQPGVGRAMTAMAEQLSRFPSTRKVLTKDGSPYGPGEVLVLTDLADSLKKVAQGGAEEFYRGELARRMVSSLQSAGGLFTEEDFAAHRTEVYEPPISTTYRGHPVYQTSPPSQGFLMLEMLNILEGYDLGSMGQNSPEAVHLMVEAKKLAFNDRNRYAGDPEYVQWPLDWYLSKGHAERRRRLIDPARVAADASLMVPVETDGDTSYFCVADGQGNCVSYIHSLSTRFGSQFIAEGTGVLFNNRAGRGFSLEEGHPNIIAPGKRTMHTLNCYMVFENESPLYLGGTPGGDYQVQANTQVVANLIDFEMGPQGAVNAPRWWSFPGTDPDTLDRALEVRLEEGIAEETIRGLESKGHKLVPRMATGAAFGRVQLIMCDRNNGVLVGASDPRADGHAAAL